MELETIFIYLSSQKKRHMNCYNHTETVALGICKHCNKGICRDCLTDLGDGLACTATCVDEVQRVNDLIKRNLNATKNSNRNYNVTAFFYAGLGVLFLVSSFLILSRIDPILVTMGLFFIGYAAYLIYSKNKINKK